MVVVIKTTKPALGQEADQGRENLIDQLWGEIDIIIANVADRLVM